MKFIGIKNIMRETGIEVRSVKILAGIAKTLKPSEILACFHRQKLEFVSVFISAEGPLKLKETRRTNEGKCLVRIVKYDREYETFLRHELGILVPAISVDVTGTPPYTVEFQQEARPGDKIGIELVKEMKLVKEKK